MDLHRHEGTEYIRAMAHQKHSLLSFCFFMSSISDNCVISEKLDAVFTPPFTAWLISLLNVLFTENPP